MIKLFYPANYAESVFTLDYAALYKTGYRAVIFDLDNTLVPHGEDTTPEVEKLIAEVQSLGFTVFLLSDNGVSRIERFLQNISGVQYIDNAGKPKPKNYKKAVQIMGLPKEQVLYIGDQVFTDIIGANLAGLDSVLVKYIGYYDEGYTGKRRAAEAAILKKYKSSKHFNRLGNIER